MGRAEIATTVAVVLLIVALGSTLRSESEKRPVQTRVPPLDAPSVVSPPPAAPPPPTASTPPSSIRGYGSLPLLPPVLPDVSGLPTRRELIGTDGPPCVQPRSCRFLSRTLLLIHLNPQRLEWIDAVLDLAASYAPNIAFISLIEPYLVKNCTGFKIENGDCHGPYVADGPRHSRMDFLYLGKRQIKVHLVDSHFQIHGDHQDIATAMRLWPQFTGVISWEHEDSLVSFWRLPRLSLDRVWRQRPHYRWPGLPRKKASVANSRDWKQLSKALARISEISPQDSAKIIPQVSPGCSVYYVPMKHREKLMNYSALFLDVNGYNEVATPALLAAVADAPFEDLKGTDLVSSKVMYNRNKNPGLFSPDDLDYLHPARVTSDLWARVSELSRRVVLPSNWTTKDGFWTECFTCDAYPPQNRIRKGAYHTCALGCDPKATPANVSELAGVVVQRGQPRMPLGEFVHEGYWDYSFLQKIFARYPQANLSKKWPEE
eukprot:TRINITY_DN39453_c0_g1_i1.p2 TRINITY_DN39453_c0_g1~~TRINITY_DN39453_c0_g1_i1.p2  ORF type:complete len:505 (+),score=118.05 TRINITY_DN39453_c0_g1_i1:53-1516(+)